MFNQIELEELTIIGSELQNSKITKIQFQGSRRIGESS